MIFTRYEGELRTVIMMRRPLTHMVSKTLAASVIEPSDAVRCRNGETD
jgi:hypothetical protein